MLAAAVIAADGVSCLLVGSAAVEGRRGRSRGRARNTGPGAHRAHQRQHPPGGFQAAVGARPGDRGAAAGHPASACERPGTDRDHRPAGLSDRLRRDWRPRSHGGGAGDLVLDASITARADGRQIIIENTPPYFSTDDVLSGMARRAGEYQWARNHPELRRQARLPLADVRDESSRGSYSFVCVPEPGSGLVKVIERLSRVYGVQARARVHLPKPLPRMIRKDSGPSAMRIFSTAWRSWRRPLSRLGESAGQEAPAAGPARQEQRGPLD